MGTGVTLPTKSPEKSVLSSKNQVQRTKFKEDRTKALRESNSDVCFPWASSRKREFVA
jgi:hypothetical protein